MDNQYTGWHPRAIRETLRLLIPLYLTINRADIKELYPYINHEQELNELLNNFTKNLLPNTNTQDNIDRFREIILNNQPLPITARCTKHAVGILIYNGYLVYFNTGHTTNPLDSGAMYYKIPNIAALLNYTVTEQDDYSRRVVEKNFLQRLSEFFPTVAVLEKFVADLVTSGLLIRIYLQNIPPQEVGDCSMRALSYLVPAMLTIKIQEQQSSTLSWTQKAKWAVVKHTLLPLQNFAYRKNQNYKNSNYMWTLSNLHNAETIKFRKATKIAFAAWEKMYEHAKNIFLENILALGILEPEFIDEVSNHIKKEATDKLAPHNIGIIIQQDKFTSTRIGIDYVHRSTMQFWQASQSKRPIFAQKYGFNVIPIPGDGHCLFNAVSLYLDNTSTSPRALRTKVANHIEDHLEQYQDIITALNPDTTVEMHIRAIRDHEWADNLEIAVLMRVLDRPIYVIDSDGKIRNRGINITGSGDPIFVYYNGHNHYDGLLIQAPEMTGQEILELLILENRASIVQLPATRQPQIFKNMKKRKIDQTEINHNDLEPAPKKRRIF